MTFPGAGKKHSTLMNEMKTANWKVAQDEAEEESKVVQGF